MRHYPDPNDGDDNEELAELNAPAWMIEVLRINNSSCYASWAPGDDSLPSWHFDGWAAFAGTWKLNDLNECVNFYFEVERDAVPAAHLNLALWLILPRKGESWGVHIKNIQQGELSGAVAFLREAAERNANRFAGVTQL